MAIIAPSRAFEGSDLSTNIFGKVIKDGVRTINFREDRNKEGNFFFILPPYKADALGRGVSWRVIAVRDNFGIDPKEIFAVAPSCPVEYFAARAKQFFPEYSKVETVQLEGGRTQKKWPPFGRKANKVLFNVAYLSKLTDGAHVLTLPQFGGGEAIEAWSRAKTPTGEPKPLLNDPNAAVPIFIQLKKGNVIGQPWVVQPDASSTQKLPAELCDSDYLYNLDDVVHYPTAEQLIEKLRSFVPSDIFTRCMAGYSNGSSVTIAMSSTAPVTKLPSASPDEVPMAFPKANATVPSPPTQAPSFPRATVAAGPPAPPAEIMQSIPASHTSNPVSMAGFDLEAAKKFLATKPAAA